MYECKTKINQQNIIGCHLYNGNWLLFSRKSISYNSKLTQFIGICEKKESKIVTSLIRRILNTMFLSFVHNLMELICS